jgi:ribose transport system permease protein
VSTLGRRRAIVRPLIPYLVWEGVLLLALVVVALTARAAQPQVFSDGVVWVQWAILGLLASAVALSLRMATPNLAIPALAALSSVWFVDRANDGSSLVVAAIVAVLLCLVHGLLLGVFVGVTGVPAWAASLGALALLQAYMVARAEGQITRLTGGALQSRFVWFLLFAVLSVIGAVALATPAVRARLTSAGSGGMSSRLITALIGLGGSSAVAGLAGVLLARRIQGSQATVPSDLLLLALGIALVAGVSVYGGQGPIFGVVLASGIATVIVIWILLAGAPVWSQLVVAGIMILAGLLVSWLLSVISRRIPA